MLPSFTLQEEIAGRAAVRAGAALAGQPDLRAVGRRRPGSSRGASGRRAARRARAPSTASRSVDLELGLGVRARRDGIPAAGARARRGPAPPNRSPKIEPKSNEP